MEYILAPSVLGADFTSGCYGRRLCAQHFFWNAGNPVFKKGNR